MRGQVALEFIVMIGTACLIFTVFTTIAFYYLNQYNYEQKIQLVNNLGFKIQQEISLAGSVSDGYQRSISIPERVGNKGYTITLYTNSFSINYSDEYTAEFPIPNISSGSLQPGTNVITKLDGNISIGNETLIQ